MKFKLINISLMVFFALSACTPKVEPKTVDYYLKNDSERNNLMAKCMNNLGKYKDDPDCINASQAALQARANHKWVK